MTRVKQFVLAADWLIPLLILLLLCLAFLPGGVPNTADGPVHFIRSAEMVQAWQDGILLPRWAANLGNGYGLPLFVYAPPLPYALTAFIQMFGFPLEVAFKGTWLIALLIGAFGAYHLSRVLLGRMPGAVGAAAYIYAPIMLRELFIQGNVAQLLAWMFTPWACFGLIQLFRSTRLRAGLLVALAVMGTLLSHNAAALLLAATVGGMSLTLWLFTHNGRALLTTFISSVLGLALSAWFWAPALLEGKYVQLARIVASDFRPRFISLTELIALSPRLDTGAINPFFPLTLGSVQVWIALLGALLLCFRLIFRRRTAQPLETMITALGLFFVPFTFFCAFMATQWSEPVWSILPFVNLFEWPFRWHGFTAVGLSWLCAFAVFAIGLYLPRWINIVGIVGLCLLIGSALVNLYPDKLPVGTFKATPADIVRFETETGQIGTTSLGEFDPIWAVDTLKKLPVPDDYRRHRLINRLPKKLPANATGSLEFSNVQTQRYHLTLPAPVTLTFNLLYFPGWQVTLDNGPADHPLLTASPHPGNGLLDVSLPPGEHTLTLHFGETPLRQRADLISGVTWLGLVLFSVVLIARKMIRCKDAKAQKRNNQPAIMGDHGRQITASVAAPIAILIGIYLLIPNSLQVHSQPDQALLANIALHADFGNQMRLLGVDPPPLVVAPGDTIQVVTYWRALQRLSTNYGIFLHLDTSHGQTIATVDQTHPNNIPTSKWAPSLYVRVPLRLTIPIHALPIHYRVRVGIIEPQSGAWLSPVGGQGDVLEIGQLWVEPPTTKLITARPKARFGPTIQLLDVHYDETARLITLTWRGDAPIPKDYKIFVHALAANNTMLGQNDAAPYQDQYPTSAWRPQQIIEDQRDLTNIILHRDQLSRFAIGLYDPINGERLPATDEVGKPLPDNVLMIDLASLK